MVSEEFTQLGNAGPLQDVLYYARSTPVPKPRESPQ
jgi:hypothetical protein